MNKILERVLSITLMPTLAYCVYIDTPVVTNIALVVFWCMLSLTVAVLIAIIFFIPLEQYKYSGINRRKVLLHSVQGVIVQGTSMYLLYLAGAIWLLSTYVVVVLLTICVVGSFIWALRD